jgi:ATP-dependent Lhr-like helicase
VDPPTGELHERLRAHLASRGASFFRELYTAAGGGDEEAVLEALWDLVWAGEVTNDTFAPLRLAGPAARRTGQGRRPRLPRLTQPRAAGRWSLVSSLAPVPAAPTERLHALAGVLLQRYGVLTRESVVAEGWAGGFSALYPVLRAMEEAGRIRRGYFVAGMGGSQFALPGAVDRLRGAREAQSRVLALAATDPANPYGVVLPWPEQQVGRMARAAGAYVVLEGGELRLYLERGGRSLLTSGEVTRQHLEVLVAAVQGRIELQRVNGQDSRDSRLAPLLREAGFGSSHRGLVHYPKTGS